MLQISEMFEKYHIEKPHDFKLKYYVPQTGNLLLSKTWRKTNFCPHIFQKEAALAFVVRPSLK